MQRANNYVSNAAAPEIPPALTAIIGRLNDGNARLAKSLRQIGEFCDRMNATGSTEGEKDTPESSGVLGQLQQEVGRLEHLAEVAEVAVVSLRKIA